MRLCAVQLKFANSICCAIWRSTSVFGCPAVAINLKVVNLHTCQRGKFE